ncbi:MAG: polysaccharide biosynthesis/export family protein, partial [Fidelibacterota bacterium]
RLESSGEAFILSIIRHIQRNYLFIYVIENELDLPIGSQESEAIDTQFKDDEDGDISKVLKEKAFRERAKNIYVDYHENHQSKFKWIRSDLFDSKLAQLLKSDADKLLKILTICPKWISEKDKKLDALFELIRKKHNDDKVLIFSQFADTVYYLEKILFERNVTQLEAATGQSASPTDKAHRFSPVSNNLQDKIKPEEEIRVLLATDVLSEGQNLQDLKQLKKEFEKVRSAQAAGVVLDTTTMNYGLPTRVIYTSKDLEAYYHTKLKLLKSEFETLKHDLDSLTETGRLDYIGYEFFSNRDTIQLWQNLPLPKDYVLGPGDEVIISLWGEVERFNRTIIGREGTIYLSDVGQISLAGKTLDEATSYLKKRLSRIYATLKGNPPSTYLDLSLGKLKGINVQFLGYVKNPGVYAVHPFSTVITGLIQAGGVDTTGSLRNIEVFRNGKKMTEVDLYTFLNSGQPSGDIQLRDQDVVFVPSRLSTVAINGSVFRPGYYEMKPRETLA